jgi:hypothetical protein
LDLHQSIILLSKVTIELQLNTNNHASKGFSSVNITGVKP